MTDNGSQWPAVTAELEEWGVTDFEYRAKLPLSQIDREASIARQPRYEALDEDHVVVIAQTMEDAPERIAPIVVTKQKSGKLRIIDGNHRVAAADLLGLTHLTAFVILEELSDFKIDSILAVVNSEHAKPLTMSERLAWAAAFVEKYGVAQVDIARMMKVPVDRVHRQVQLTRASKRLDRLGLKKHARHLGQNVKARLDGVRSDVVVVPLTELIVEAKLSAVDAGALITRINKFRSEKDQLSALEEARAQMRPETEITQGGKFSMPKCVTTIRTITGRIDRLDLASLGEELHGERDRLGPHRQVLKLKVAAAATKLAELQEMI